MEPKIVFEDPHLIVLSKPAGLLSQGEETGSPNLVDWLRGYLGRPYVGLIHRLDRNTSGLMVVAKRTKSAQRLTQALQDGRLERSYLAWVEGKVERRGGDAIQWRHYLLKDEKKNRVEVFSTPRSGAKEAILFAEVVRHGVRNGQPLTLLNLRLETGRSHQIRAQSAFEGYPLLGDAKYGARDRGFPRPALHSYRLKFPHPKGGEIQSFEEGLPQDLQF